MIFGTFTACFLSDIVANKYSSALLNIMYHEDMKLLYQWKLSLERFREIYPLHKAFLEVIKEYSYIIRGDCMLERHICD